MPSRHVEAGSRSVSVCHVTSQRRGWRIERVAAAFWRPLRRCVPEYQDLVGLSHRALKELGGHDGVPQCSSGHLSEDACEHWGLSVGLPHKIAFAVLIE